LPDHRPVLNKGHNDFFSNAHILRQIQTADVITGPDKICACVEIFRSLAVRWSDVQIPVSRNLVTYQL